MSCLLTYRGQRFETRGELLNSLSVQSSAPTTNLFKELTSLLGDRNKAYQYHSLLETEAYQKWSAKNNITEPTLAQFKTFYKEEIFSNEENRRNASKETTIHFATTRIAIDEDFLPAETKENKGEFKDEIIDEYIESTKPFLEDATVEEKKKIKRGRIIEDTGNSESNQSLIRSRFSSIRAVNRRLLTVDNTIKNSKSPESKLRHIKHRDELRDRVAGLTDDILILRRSEDLYFTQEMLSKDIEWIKDLLDANLITYEEAGSDEIAVAENIISSWSKYLSNIKEEYTDEETIHDIFGGLESRLSGLAVKVAQKKREVNIENHKEIFNLNSDSEAIENIYNPIKDMNYVGARTLDLSKSRHILLQGMQTKIAEVNRNTAREIHALYKDFEELDANVKRKMKELGVDFSIFFRKVEGEEGEYMQDTMVTPFSGTYFNIKNSKHPDLSDKADNWALYNKWFSASHHLIDIEAAVENKEAYIDTLAALVPNRTAVEVMVEDSIRKYQDFIIERENKAILLAENYDEETVNKKLYVWDKVNDPINYFKNKGKAYTTSRGNTYTLNPRFLVGLPKATYKGDDSGFYDKNFELIQQHQELADFQKFYVDTMHKMNSYLPGTTARDLFTIPLFQKTAAEAYNGKHNAKGAIVFWDKVVQEIRGDDVADDMFIEEEEGSGKRKLASNFHKSKRDKIKKRYQLNLTTWEAENGVKADKKVKRELSLKATDAVIKDSSIDVSKALRAFSALAISYKHKSQIETFLNITEEVFFDEVRKAKTDNLGRIIRTDDQGKVVGKDEEGEIMSDGELRQYRIMVNAALDTFFGVPKSKGDIIFEKAALTSDEKALKKEYQSVLNTYDDEDRAIEKAFVDGNLDEAEKNRALQDVVEKRKETEKNIEKLGSALTYGGFINAAMQWLSWKALGWNGTAGLANLVFGWLSNNIEAAGGQFYDAKSLNKASLLMLNSVGKTYGIKTDTGLKIRELMERFNVLKKQSEENFKNTSNKLKGNILLNPFGIMDTTEYLNQAPVMIAVLMTQKLKDSSGKEISIWDAFDSTGKWKTEQFGMQQDVLNNDVLKQASSTIDKAIRNNHGNYDNLSAPIALKREAYGKPLTQFRSWMLEGFANRFEGEYTDYGMGIQRKGRYRSLFSLPAIKNIHNIILKQESGEELTKIDEVNMRKNLRELRNLLTVMVAVATLSVFGKGEDDEEKDKNFLAYMNPLNVIINLFNRVQTDILFYTNPQEFKRLMKDLIPIMSLISDSIELADAAMGLIRGDDIIERGIYSGQSKFLRELMQFFPVTSSAYKIYNNSVQKFKKDKNFIESIIEESEEDL